MARTRHPGAKHSLDALCNRYGVDRTHRVKHGALLDAQLLAQVYIELTGGRQIGLGLVANAPAVSDSGTAIAHSVTRIAREARPHCAAPAEIARHRTFVAKIVNPLWERFFAPTSERGAA
jgi:DNA polymerase-3 subunit epsilon